MHEFEIDKVLPRYGIMVNNDAVVRTSYYKYFHPKVIVVVMVVVVKEVVGMGVMVVEVVILVVVLTILVLKFLLVTSRAVAILVVMTSTFDAGVPRPKRSSQPCSE